MNLSGVASCMHQPRFVKIRFKLIAIGFRHLDRSVHPTSIFYLNFYSTKASRLPVRKKAGLINPRHAYVKRSRKAIPDKIQEERFETDWLFGPIRKELDARAKELEDELSRIQRGVEQLQKEQLKWREWALIMQPLKEIVIAMRRNFFDNCGKLTSKDSLSLVMAFLDGDKTANEGDLLMDTVLVKHGVIADTDIFNDLYGISHLTAQPRLLSKCPPLLG